MALTLKQWRMMQAYTCDKMAELLDVHPNTYRAWEKNPRSISIEYADRIAKIFNVRRNDVFPEE